MMKKYLKNIKQDRGAVEVVEAAIVFPVVIFVVFVLIVYGNMMYQQAKMDAICVRGAQYLAAIYNNPSLKKKVLPTDSRNVDILPYRYLLGDSDTEANARAQIQKQIKNTGIGLFKGMTPTGKVKTCKIVNYVVYQKAEVEIEYSVNLFTLRLFDLPSLLKTTNAAVLTAPDAAEFIRNVDMILDYSEDFGLTAKIKEFVGVFMD